MRIFRHYAGLPNEVRGAVIALGNFDGVHLGHQEVIGQARTAAETGVRALTALTFEPHPRRFFLPEEPSFQITPFKTKVRHIQALGVDDLFVMHFDEDFSKQSAESFVTDVLFDGLGASHIVVGYDFVFGNRRRGTVDLLKQMAETNGFEFTAVAPVADAGGQVYSSTNIRNYLKTAQPERAAVLLGRCWEIEGRVLEGDKRGQQIGFPTANIALGEYIEPALGVYAVWAGVERGTETVWHKGVANIGNRPTFGGEGVTVEVYLFDFADDLYGQPLRAALVAYLRPEQKFDGVAAIRAQIAEDCSTARALLDKIGADDLMRPPSAPGAPGAPGAKA